MFREQLSNSMCRFTLAVGIVWALSLCVVGAAEKSTATERPSWGQVTGRVYDATTGWPVMQAEVVVENEGVFATEGRSTGKTDETGQYTCQAQLGKVSSRFSFGRLLQTGLLAHMLTGSANRKTLRVDVSRLNLRVFANGYETFEGVVPCQTVDAERFRVDLEPVLLVKQGIGEISTVAPGWGPVRVRSVELSPAVATPGGKIAVEVRVDSPPAPRGKPFLMSYLSGITGGPKTLKLSKDANADVGRPLVFAGTINIPKKPRKPVDILSVSLSSCPFTVSVRTATALLQVPQTAEQRSVCESRGKAFQLIRDKRYPEALGVLQPLIKEKGAVLDDCLWLEDVASRLHRYDDVATALERAVELAPEKDKPYWRVRHAEALALAGHYDKALAIVSPLTQPTGKRDLSIGLTQMGPLVVAGRCYLSAGDFEKAVDVEKQLDKIALTARGDCLSATDVYWRAAAERLRKDIRFQRAEKVLKSNPRDAKVLTAYARILADRGRWEEAALHFQKALQVNPNLDTARYDLEYVLARMRGKEPAVENLEEAVVAAEKQTLPDGKTESRDFHVWHRLAVLRYRLAQRSEQEHAADASALMQKAIDSFAKALRYARAGATVKDGIYDSASGYTGARVTSIAGFAYPEADADYLLLDSLQVIQKDANNYLAWFNIGSALRELKQFDLAQSAVVKCLAIKSDFVEGHYALADIARQVGRHAEAIREMEFVLTKNPRHYRANLDMAELLTQLGHAEEASFYLAAHARHYGT